MGMFAVLDDSLVLLQGHISVQTKPWVDLPAFEDTEYRLTTVLQPKAQEVRLSQTCRIQSSTGLMRACIMTNLAFWTRHASTHRRTACRSQIKLVYTLYRNRQRLTNSIRQVLKQSSISGSLCMHLASDVTLACTKRHSSSHPACLYCSQIALPGVLSMAVMHRMLDIIVDGNYVGFCCCIWL